MFHFVLSAVVVLPVMLICAFVPALVMLMFPMMVITQDYGTKNSMPPETEIVVVLVLPASLNQEICHRHYTTSDEEDPFKRQH